MSERELRLFCTCFKSIALVFRDDFVADFFQVQCTSWRRKTAVLRFRARLLQRA